MILFIVSKPNWISLTVYNNYHDVNDSIVDDHHHHDADYDGDDDTIIIINVQYNNNHPFELIL